MPTGVYRPTFAARSTLNHRPVEVHTITQLGVYLYVHFYTDVLILETDALHRWVCRRPFFAYHPVAAMKWAGGIRFTLPGPFPLSAFEYLGSPPVVKDTRLQPLAKFSLPVPYTGPT